MIELIIQAINEPSAWVIFSLFGQILALFHIPSVLLRRKNPHGQLAWIMCLFLFPYVGVITWWFLGRTRIEKKKQKHLIAREIFSEALVELPTQTNIPNASSWIALNDGFFPTTANNEVKTFVKGIEAFPALLRTIENAKEHVHMEFYIWNADATGRRFRDALVAAVQRGVRVRVILDAVGSGAVTGTFMNVLRNAGGEIAIFSPVRIFKHNQYLNFRNHRKLVVIDAEFGFTGGLNIGDEYNIWFDTFFRFKGPVVNQLQKVFCEGWFFVTGEELLAPHLFQPKIRPQTPDQTPDQTPFKTCEYSNVVTRVIASGPDCSLHMIHSIFFIAITSAVERVYITTPYFIPDDAILAALRTAVIRGVDVRLLVPGKSDVAIAQWAGRGYFRLLLEAGIRIFEFQPEILHAKLMVIDHRFSIIGSANMDTRSFHLQFEVNTAMDSIEQNALLAKLFENQLKSSNEIHFKDWELRSTFQQLKEASARLLSPLL